MASIDQAIAHLARTPRILRLECQAQHYAWGDPDFIPALIGEPNPERRPFAELWIGAHPELPASALINGIPVALDRLIAAAPRAILGDEGIAAFGPQLPFLLKVLAAAHPLSIQVHPDPEQARAGFAREDEAGIPRDAPQRNYRDRMHKPELLVALTDFYALRGFRPLEAIARTLAQTPELCPETDGFSPTEAGLRSLYQHLMRLPRERVDALLDPLVERLASEDRLKSFALDDYRHWLLRADREFSIPPHRDRGLFSLLLLNLVHLQPGQGIFLDAGELHAYLGGAGVELMANSNNVLRGGLTPKHIDVEELLAVIRTDAGPAPIIEPEVPLQATGNSTNPLCYRAAAPEFALQRWDLQAGQPVELVPRRVTLGLVTEGELSARTPGHAPLALSRGSTFLLPATATAELCCDSAATLYIAREPAEGGQVPRDG